MSLTPEALRAGLTMPLEQFLDSAAETVQKWRRRDGEIHPMCMAVTDEGAGLIPIPPEAMQANRKATAHILSGILSALGARRCFLAFDAWSVTRKAELGAEPDLSVPPSECDDRVDSLVIIAMERGRSITRTMRVRGEGEAATFEPFGPDADSASDKASFASPWTGLLDLEITCTPTEAEAGPTVH